VLSLLLQRQTQPSEMRRVLFRTDGEAFDVPGRRKRLLRSFIWPPALYYVTDSLY